MDSTVSSKEKTKEGEGVGTCSLVRNTSGVEGHARVPRWGLKRVKSKSITHIDVHKPNNKLVNA
jgi:hypothetical protein